MALTVVAPLSTFSRRESGACDACDADVPLSSARASADPGSARARLGSDRDSAEPMSLPKPLAAELARADVEPLKEGGGGFGFVFLREDIAAQSSV